MSIMKLIIRYPYAKKTHLNQYFTSHIKIHSKWIIDLNIKLKTVKLIEGKHRRTFV